MVAICNQMSRKRERERLSSVLSSSLEPTKLWLFLSRSNVQTDRQTRRNAASSGQAKLWNGRGEETKDLSFSLVFWALEEKENNSSIGFAELARRESSTNSGQGEPCFGPHEIRSGASRTSSGFQRPVWAREKVTAAFGSDHRWPSGAA